MCPSYLNVCLNDANPLTVLNTLTTQWGCVCLCWKGIFSLQWADFQFCKAMSETFSILMWEIKGNIQIEKELKKIPFSEQYSEYILSTQFQISCACFQLWPFQVADFLALYSSCGNENKVLASKTCQNVPKEWAVKNIFKQISRTLSCYSVPTQKHIVTVVIYIFTEIFPHCSFHFCSVLLFINKNRWNNFKLWVLKKNIVNILIWTSKFSKVKMMKDI